MVRSLHATEINVANHLRKLGLATRWEWMVALDSASFNALTLRTDRRDDGTDADQAMKSHWSSGGSVIIHHNHPSGESLSHPDWLALTSTTELVSEIFAHVIDGAIYYGTPTDRAGLAQALTRYGYAELAAQNSLDTSLRSNPPWLYYAQSAAGDAGLRKHAVSLALAAKQLVIYEFDGGSTVASLLAELATPIQAAVAAALAAL